ncbi:chloride channel [Pelagophyceae sp. CCMP2097]|nr:chloride channel [Pelagophyceae sp. CCMP2097]
MMQNIEMSTVPGHGDDEAVANSHPADGAPAAPGLKRSNSFSNKLFLTNDIFGSFRTMTQKSLVRTSPRDRDYDAKPGGWKSPLKAPLSLGGATHLYAQGLTKLRATAHYFWIFLLLLAFSVSIAAFLIEVAHTIIHDGLEATLRFGNGGIVLYLIVRVVLVLLAVEFTKRVSPIAAGSGIPEVKAILAGFSIPGFLSMRTGVAKVGGVILLFGAGLPIGKEGPFIHTASIIAENLLQIKWFRAMNDTPEFRKQMLSAAAAVGVAAAFGAPIGGIMFSIEATATFYATQHYWGTFFCSSAAAFISHEIGYDAIAAFSPHFDKLPYKRWEVFLFAFLSVICGLLGGLWVKLFVVVVSTRRHCATLVVPPFDASGAGICARAKAFFEASGIFVARWVWGNNYGFAVFSSFITGLPAVIVGRYMHLSTRAVLDDLFQSGTLLAKHNANLHSDWAEPSVMSNLVIFTLCLTFGSVICITLPVSNGLVTPSFAIGAALGRLFGELFRLVAKQIKHQFGFVGRKNPLSFAGGYAIVGSAAFSTAVTGKISIGVVICELTGQLSYSIPVLVACVLGLAFGGLIEIDIYSMLAQIKKLPHWPTIKSVADLELTVRDVFDHASQSDCHPVPLKSRKGRSDSVDGPPRGIDGGVLRIFEVRRDELQRSLDAATHAMMPIVVDPESMVFVGAARTVDLQALCDQHKEEAFVDVRDAGINYTWPRVDLETSLSQVCFIYSFYQCTRIFVLNKSELVGSLDSTTVEMYLHERSHHRGADVRADGHSSLALQDDAGAPGGPGGGAKLHPHEAGAASVRELDDDDGAELDEVELSSGSRGQTMV